MDQTTTEGILLIDKPTGCTSFSLIGALRRRLGIKKIGHAGTLDPFASGVMVLLVGRNYTRQSDSLLTQDKAYEATLYLGVATDTHDTEGRETARSKIIPTREEILKGLTKFQGAVEQVPPMYSAKKLNGKKLYDLARRGIEVERKAVKVTLDTQLLEYTYPELRIRVSCSKGTYIRVIGHDIGELLGCHAHLTQLRRIRSGQYTLEQCITMDKVRDLEFPLESALLKKV